jgi:DNA modification methylase
MKDTILFGDCRETLKTVDTKVRMCVTSPPYYGLRDYGTSNWEGGDNDCDHVENVCPKCGAVRQDSQIGLEETPEEYIDQLIEVFKEVRNVLIDDGTCWVNIGDSYYNYRPGKGQGLPKQTVSNTKQDLPDVCSRRGNQLYGLKEKDLIGIPWMFAFAMRADGWYLRQDIIWHKPNPMPESVKDRCTKAHEYIFLFSKNKKYYYNNEAIKEEAVGERWGGNTPINMNNTKDIDNTFSGLTRPRKMVYEKRNKRSVWEVTTKPYKGAHFAVFPEELIEPCILAGSEEGDIVLDPFIGSGTTARVAKKHGRYYLGCELNKKYDSLQTERISQIQQRLC